MKRLTIILTCLLIMMSCTILVSTLSESLIFAGLVNIRWENHSSFVDKWSLPFLKHYGHQSHVYGVVIDAGSTGTRIHIYKFLYNLTVSGPVYSLVEEVLDEVRPGLSSYASNSSHAREGLQKLLTLARRRIPVHLTRFTHVTMRATAGLRLLSPPEAEALLREARTSIAASGFIVDRVDIMDGLEEALQAWVTVNYLLGRLGDSTASSSFGIMDLGGASTQVTFVPQDPSTLLAVPEDHRHSLELGHSSVELYTHSYLGLGLMSARLALLSSAGGLRGSSLFSPCMPHNYQGHWTHGGVRYTISSTSVSNVSLFEECYRRSRVFVTKQVLHPPELRQRPFYLFSYFYDRVKDAGVDPATNYSHKQITLDDYRQLAINVCLPTHKLNHRKPFLCLDLVYIYSLLKDGYQFDSTSSFYLSKEINNIELGWALGVVFDLLYRTELV